MPFVINAIPINIKTEDSEFIKGFKTKLGNEIAILNYADDTTFIVRDKNSISKIFDLLLIHGQSTEAKVNEDKTEILMMGCWKDKPPDIGKYKQYRR